jgi:hypothetical protein
MERASSEARKTSRIGDVDRFDVRKTIQTSGSYSSITT